MGRLNIVSVTIEKYKRFLITPQTIMILFVLVYIIETAVSPMITLSKETGFEYMIVEPLLLVFTNTRYEIVLPILVVVLLSDFPEYGNDRIFCLTRMTKKKWVLSELVYAILVGVTTVVVFSVGILFYVLVRGGWCLGNSWSGYTQELYFQNPEIYEANTNLFLKTDVVAQGKPVEVLLYGISLLILYLVLLSLGLMLCKLFRLNLMRVLILLVITISGSIVCETSWIGRWAFPTTHALFGTHFETFLSKTEVSIAGSYMFFAVAIILLTALCLVRSKHIDLLEDMTL